MPHVGSSTVEELLVRARQGDAEQRDRLFDACRGYLQLVARAQLATWAQAKLDPSDLVQQTMLEAHRDFERFEGRSEGEWLAWLRRILTHNAADVVRHYRGTEKRQAGREASFALAADSQTAGIPEPAAREPSPSQQLICRDRDLQIAAALERLTADHREVIVLRNLQQLSFEEVALRLGRSRPAVQMLWARAIKKLQQELSAVGELSGEAL